MPSSPTDRILQGLDVHSDSMSVVIVDNQKLRRDIYRLRYRISIEEMKKTIPYADHTNRMIYDEFDSDNR